MSAGLEVLAVDQWITETLQADSTLMAMLGQPEVFTDTIPDHVQYPYVISNMMSAREVLTTDQTTVIAVFDYQIKGVDRSSSYAGLRPVALRIHQVLHQGSGIVTDGQVLKCSRQRQIHYPQVTETVHHRHLGGLYRLWVEGAQ